jgi:acetyl esterase/lipase
MAVTSAAGLGRPRRWAAGLAWGLWALAMLGLAVVPWLDSLLRQAGRPDLVVFVPGSVVGPVVAMLSAATVGAVLASRRPRHPVTGEADVVRDEGEAYADKLREAGVPVTADRFQAIIHDFVMLNALADTNAARGAITLATDTLRAVLSDKT